MCHTAIDFLRSATLAEECNGSLCEYLAALTTCLQDPSPRHEEAIAYRLGVCVREIYGARPPGELDHEQCVRAVAFLLQSLREQNEREWVIVLSNAIGCGALYSELLTLSPFAGKLFIPVGSWSKEGVAGASLPLWMGRVLTSLGLPTEARHAIFLSPDEGKMTVLPFIDSVGPVPRS